MSRLQELEELLEGTSDQDTRDVVQAELMLAHMDQYLEGVEAFEIMMQKHHSAPISRRGNLKEV